MKHNFDKKCDKFEKYPISLEEIQAVIEWYSTEGGKQYLSTSLERLVEENKVPELAFVPSAEMWNNIQISRKRRPVSKNRMWKWAVAACIPLFLLLGGITYMNSEYGFFKEPEWSEVSMASGEQSHLILPDGTSVYMGPKSRLRYPRRFSFEKREIYFEGEAYFDVRSDSKHPFYVRMEGLTIKVLGTSFNVIASPLKDTYHVKLDKGKVFLSDDNKKTAMMRPGEMMTYNRKTGELSFKETEIMYIPNWKDRTIHFNEAPLPVVLDVLSKMYGKQFVLNGYSLKTYTYTFILSQKTLAEVQYVLECMTPIRFDDEKDFIRVSLK